MENNKIHEGLEKSKNRDFLAKQIRACEGMLIELKNEPPNKITKKGIEIAIESCENQIEELTRTLNILRNIFRYETIISSNGWMQFDVSDETQKEQDEQLWLDFIGTKEEYEALLSKIENEKK